MPRNARSGSARLTRECGGALRGLSYNAIRLLSHLNGLNRDFTVYVVRQG
jgi:hypothetical protein